LIPSNKYHIPYKNTYKLRHYYQQELFGEELPREITLFLGGFFGYLVTYQL